MSPHVFAAILLVPVLAIAFDGIAWLAERRTASWRLASKSADKKAPRAAARAIGTQPAGVAP